MDIARLSVLIWLLLPIPIYGISRYRRSRLIRKLPSTASGRIVEVISYRLSFSEYNTGSMDLAYKFNVGDLEYTGQCTLEGINHKPGEEIRVRYDPERPQESMIDQPTTTRSWILLGLLALALDLGYAFFSIFVGLLCLLAGILIALRLSPQLQLTLPRRILYSLLCILAGLPFIAAGVYGLMVDGFLGQNILWMLWSHRTIYGTPW